MKTKLSPLCPTFAWLRWAKLVSYVVCLFTLCPAPSALSQIPQGFNYQAIARDGDGPLEGPIDIYIAITTDDTEIPVVLWEELHDDIYPNTQGLFNIVVGGGLTQTGDFSLIDWTKTPLYIRTKINSTVMGIEPLWSVPYAMVADSLGGPLKNLKVKAPATASNTEALFEVKNKTGQTVFAVYNEGVRIYVSDGDKGPKGGFAIGGFSTGKAPSQPYLIVNPDTVRIYVNQSGKGVKGGFAIGGYGTDKADPQDFLFISDDSVRIYVDNADADTTKGVKGGFAIGGYGTAKGKPQDLLVVNNDSVRIYVDNNPTDKGPKGGFAIGGYGTDKG
ncbi:MAG: hypothetical protein NTW82_08450, partial [Bacteroidia bacterium]|nr:hypothetical protein [Bacteroidia bacterium]